MSKDGDRMKTESDGDLAGNDPGLRRAVRALGIAVAAIALAALAGVSFGIPELARIVPELPALVPSTSLCFLALAVSLAVRGRHPDLPAGAIYPALAVAAVAIANLALPQGIDRLLGLPLEPGDGMSPSTAILFILAAYAMFALAQRRAMWPTAFQVAATAGILLPLVAIVAFIYRVNEIYGAEFFAAISAPTAVSFALLFSALLLVRPEASWVHLLTGSGAGSRTARRLLPIFLAAVVALTYTALLAIRAGHFASDIILSILAIGTVTIAGIIILRHAAIENAAQRELFDTLERLSKSDADKTLLLREIYHRVMNNLQQIGAMIRLERRQHEDPVFAEALNKLAGRVRTMGLVHQMLIASETPSSIDAGGFLDKLVASVYADELRANRQIEITHRTRVRLVDLDLAVSLGLLVNELLSEALDHAFPAGKPGCIVVTLDQTTHDFRLEIADNGEVQDEALRSRPASRIGGMVIGGMVTELNGTIRRDHGNGCRVTVTIPASQRAARAAKLADRLPV